MFKSFYLQGYARFLILTVVTVGLTYYAPHLLATAWYVFLLVWYYRSSDEPFWLVFFLTTTDGFMSFMGIYEVTISVLPGLPSIELVQFYILLSVIKASRVKKGPYIFFNRFLIVLGIYVIFMIIWGQLMGSSGGLNTYLRIVKLILPLLLFYSLPRLFRTMSSFERMFRFFFFVLLTGFITQLITVIVGDSPAGMLGISFDQDAEPGEYRGFYNMAATLAGLAGALFYLSSGKKGAFGPVYLYILVFSAYMMALLSATRGWIISFSVIILLTMVFSRVNIRRITAFFIVLITISYLGWSNARIRDQLAYSRERLESLEYLGEGDITAGGTLKRLTVRGPRVMNVWKANPVFGWGFSDTTWRYTDGHVANQNLLMTSGIAGVILLASFFLFFSMRMIERYFALPRSHQLRNPTLVLILFLWGWVLIHSTSGQQFSYGGVPLLIMPQAVIFTFGAFIYRETLRMPLPLRNG
jgi:hypothetical protein